MKMLVIAHLLVVLLVGSFLWPVTGIYWEKLDLLFFQAANNSLKGHPQWQIFWALLNHPLMDWVGDLVMLLLFFVYIKQARSQMRYHRIAECVFTAFYLAAVIFFVIGVFFRGYLRIHRVSPSLVVDSSIRISKEIDWLKIKDRCSRSFPGDHATTVLLFAFCFSYFASWRLGLLAFLYAVLLSLPRLFLGAHWLSDILIGSLPISIVCFAWAFYTPFKDWIVGNLTAFHQKIRG